MKPLLYKIGKQWWCRIKSKGIYDMWAQNGTSPKEAYSNFKFYANYYNAPFKSEIK